MSVAAPGRLVDFFWSLHEALSFINNSLEMRKGGHGAPGSSTFARLLDREIMSVVYALCNQVRANLPRLKATRLHRFYIEATLNWYIDEYLLSI